MDESLHKVGYFWAYTKGQKNMKLSDLLERVEQLIKKGEVLESTNPDPVHGIAVFADRNEYANFRVSSLNFLGRVFGKDSPSYIAFNAGVDDMPYFDNVKSGLGILRAAKEELQGGWLTTTKGIISAEVFSDFLEMAGHLLAEGYKDAAAVIIGSTLEGHLRQLCQKNNIPITIIRSGKVTPKKADLLNVELAKVGVYEMLDQKNITAQLDLRNKAAHGQYDSYTDTQVQIMYQSVLEFMTRVPA